MASTIQTAIGLLWRYWRQSYGGTDDHLLNDTDRFLETWPVEALDDEPLVAYVTDPTDGATYTPAREHANFPGFDEYAWGGE